MYIQKITTFVLLGAYALSYTSLFAAPQIPTLDCEYNDKFQQCMKENQGGNPRSIEDFVCLQSQDQAKVLDQIILDTKFGEIQERKLELLQNFENDKESSITNIEQNIDDITKMLSKEGIFYREYKALCNGGILKERLTCSEKIPNSEAGQRLRGSTDNSACLDMAQTHIDIYRQTAIDRQALNKSEVQRDNRQKYEQEIRTKYDNLLQLMLDIIGFLERLYNGLTHFTPNPR